MMWQYLIAPLIGFIGMMSGGYWGVGCGWFVVPAMLVAGVDMLTAVGVALLQMMLATVPTVIRQFPEIGWSAGSLGRRLAVPICLSAMVMSLFGKAANIKLIALFGNEKPIQVIFIVCVSIICVQTAFSRTACYQDDLPEISRRQSWRGALYGATAGLFSSMCGIGGGVFIRPLLTTVFRVPEYYTSRIVRLSVLLTTGLGGITYLWGRSAAGSDMLLLSALAALGGLAGFPLGSWMHTRVYQAGYAQHIHKSFSLIALFSVFGAGFKLANWNWLGERVILGGAAILVIYLVAFTVYAIKHPSKCNCKG